MTEHTFFKPVEWTDHEFSAFVRQHELDFVIDEEQNLTFWYTQAKECLATVVYDNSLVKRTILVHEKLADTKPELTHG